MNWLPITTPDLPRFVYTTGRPYASTNQPRDITMLLVKSSLLAKQRMETPVLYFYSDSSQTVNVRVDFPQGNMTEWYPEAKRFGPVARPNPQDSKKSRTEWILDWQNITVEAPVRSTIQLTNDHAASHYYAARDVDANDLLLKNTVVKS
jgi:hypothetical protein